MQDELGDLCPRILRSTADSVLVLARPVEIAPCATAVSEIDITSKSALVLDEAEAFEICR